MPKGEHLKTKEGMTKCGDFGHSNKRGDPCGAMPIKGRQGCRVHGGKTRAGVNHPRFRHGLYSNYMPLSVLERREELTDILSVRALDEEIENLVLREQELWQELQSLENAEEAASLLDAFNALRTLMSNGAGQEDVSNGMEHLRRSIQSLGRKDKVWAQMLTVMEHKRRHVETRLKLTEFMRPETSEFIAKLMGEIVHKWLSPYPEARKGFCEEYMLAMQRLGFAKQPTPVDRYKSSLPPNTAGLSVIDIEHRSMRRN